MAKRIIEGKDPSWGRKEHSCMPQEKMVATYPKMKTNAGMEMDDTMAGIDEVVTRGQNTMSKHKSNLK